jgi:hypothetical protein
MTRKRTLFLALLALAILIPAGIAFADSRGSLDSSVPAPRRSTISTSRSQPVTS